MYIKELIFEKDHQIINGKTTGKITYTANYNGRILYEITPCEDGDFYTKCSNQSWSSNSLDEAIKKANKDFKAFLLSYIEYSKTVFAVCNLDCETWTISSVCGPEPHSDWDHVYYTWIKGYLIDDKAEINTCAFNKSNQSFFFEPLKGTWLHFRDNKPCVYDTDQFFKEEKFMLLESLDIEATLKEKLQKLATDLVSSYLVKEEFAKPYYGK